MKKLTTLVLALAEIRIQEQLQKKIQIKQKNQKQLQLKALMRTMKKQIWKCLMMHKESL